MCDMCDFRTGLMLMEVFKLRQCTEQILEAVHQNKGNNFSMKATRGKTAYQYSLDCAVYAVATEHKYTSYQEFNEIHDAFASYLYKSRF